MLGDYEAAVELSEQVAAAARAAGDDGLLARSELVRVEASVQSDPNATMRESIAVVERALGVLERAGDEVGAVWALRLLAVFTGWIGRSDEMLRLLAGARERAERVSPRIAADLAMWMGFAIWWGHTPTDEGIRLCDDLLSSSESKRVEGVTTMVRGLLKAERGRLEDGRADVAAGRALLRELGSSIWWAGTAMGEADLELSSAGDPARAYEALAESRAVLSSGAETGYLASVIAVQAQARSRAGPR